MKITIVKQDNIAVIDGVARSVDCAALLHAAAPAAVVHAVQWDSDRRHGWVEYVRDPHADPAAYLSNRAITDFAPFQSFLDAHPAAAARTAE